jgi:integrase
MDSEFTLERFFSSQVIKKINTPYYYALNNFDKHLHEIGKSLDTFTPSDVELYMSNMNSPNSAKVYLTAIRKYALWRAQNVATSEEYLMENRRFVGLKLIKPPKIIRKIEKKALTIEELKTLLDATKYSYPLYSATIVHFYFGARPIELSKYIVDAKIDLKNRYMIIKTAKNENDRILPWSKEVHEYVKFWINYVNSLLVHYKHPQEWYTKNIKSYSKKNNLPLTAKTGRRTFETQMRKMNIEQWKIDALLGHTSKIPDVYTDWTMLLDELREVMDEKHYMMVNKLYLGLD